MTEKMRPHPVFKVTVPAGEYVLGDPYYSVPNERWGALLESCGYFDGSPIGEVDGCQVLAFATQYGDGVYQGPNGTNLGVDSGLIGLVPVDFPGRTDCTDLTCRVRFDSPTVCQRSDEGTLRFGPYRIKTGD